MSLRRLTILILAASLTSAGVRAAQASESAGVEFFESKVRPVLADRCYKCHSAGAEKLKGDLHLDTPAGILKGGESGVPAVTPHKPDDSLMLSAVKWQLDDLRMPPKEKLPEAQIADIESWIKMGAPMPAPATTQPASQPVAAARPVRMSLEEAKTFWSFVPPTLPKVPEAAGGRTDVDRFVLAKLAEKKLALSPEADRRTLIRRVTYDLTGLPPTADEADAFAADTSPDAYEKLVDRLLASPRYGERWARHWLDVARYADTKGYVFEEERRYPFSYTYRDWVIDSFNRDLPYDQFLTHQIAADRELATATDKKPQATSDLAALGFLTLGRRFINNQHDIIDDRIDVVCRGTMALTVACARCHDHKYDPIPTADYYSLYGVFASSAEPKELPLLGTKPTGKDAEAYEKEHARLTSERDDFLAAKRDEIARQLRSPAQLTRYLLAGQRALAVEAELPFDTVDDDKTLNRFTVTRWQTYLKEAAAKNDPVFAPWRELSKLRAADFATDVGPALLAISANPHVNPIVRRELCGRPAPTSVQDLASRYAATLAMYDRDAPYADDPAAEQIRQVLRADGSPVEVKLDHVERRFAKPDADRLRQLRNAVDTLAVTHPGSPPRAMAMEDLPQPVAPHILKRGNPGTPGDQVPRQFLAVLAGPARTPFKDGSGRLDLARAIASKDNPLTARVIVNRIWQWHFGQGLVRTPSDFGTRGERPTHPELLDYLAVKFTTDDARSIKKLHKRILLSATYRQSSKPGTGNWELGTDPDPENRYLSHFPLQRLDFEELRDSLLAASRALDLTPGGRPVDITADPSPPRRTVYAYVDRQNLPGLFRTFDFASPDGHVAARPNTSVPQQALYMLNSPFVLQQSKKLAALVSAHPAPTTRGTGDSPVSSSSSSDRITRLYRSALSRNPTPDELTLAESFLRAEESQPKETTPVVVSAWSYGYGPYDDATGRVKSFTPMPHFAKSAAGYQGGTTLPDSKLGWALLTAGGGHAGNDPAHAVVRRFTAPRDCTVSLAGSLEHKPPEGDGVRGRLVSSREGTLATYLVHHRKLDTGVSSLTLGKGDTLDFVVDCGPANNFGWDQFAWTVKLTALPTPGAPAGQDPGQSWDSAADFKGPPGADQPSLPLTPWEKLAQVLLESNEFMFVD